MINFKQSDMKHNYLPSDQTGDDLDFRGFPDNVLLNRNQKYEVFDFICRYMESRKLTTAAQGQKIEKLIKKDLPGDIRSFARIKKWLDDTGQF